MRSFWRVMLVVLFVFAFQCEVKACDEKGCGNNGNHYGWYKWKGGSANASSLSIANQWQGQSQSQSLSNTFNPSVVNNINTGVGGGGTSVAIYNEAVPDFPQPYVPIPAVPLPYTGTLKESAYTTDQMWFKRPKWTRGMVENLPNKGRVTDAIFEKTEAAKYFYVKDGRGERQVCEDEERERGSAGDRGVGKCKALRLPKGVYFLGSVYCESGGAGDKPGLVWGGCSRRLLDKGCTYAVLTSGIVSQGVRSNAVNQSGGAGLAGIFGYLFGFNLGGGASNTDHEATAYEILSMTWECYGVLPSQQ